MLLNNIKLTLKDLLKDGILVVFYILFFGCVTFALISVTQSLVHEIKNRPSADTSDYTRFDTYVIEKDLKDTGKLMDDLSEVYRDDAFSYCALSLRVKKGAPVRTYLMFGDPGQAYPFLKSEQDFYIAAGKEAIEAEQIFLNDESYPIDKELEKNYVYKGTEGLEENTDELAFIIIKQPELSEWISEENTEVIMEIISNTHILKKEKEKMQQFLDSVGTDFVEIREQKQGYSGEEFGFILGQMYPFLLILLICYFLCTSIILDGMMKKRAKEFTLHLLQGARLSDIVFRLGLYYGIILLLADFICFLLGIAEKEELWMYLLVNLTFLFLILVMIVKKLKKKDLSENLIIGGMK